MYSKGAKNMKLRHFTVKEEIKKQRMLLENIKVDFMIAYLLIKGLQLNIFKEHVQRMGHGCGYD